MKTYEFTDEELNLIKESLEKRKMSYFSLSFDCLKNGDKEGEILADSKLPIFDALYDKLSEK